MRRLHGLLDGRKVYDDDPNLVNLVRKVNYIAVATFDYYSIDAHCEYCGRKVNGDECKSCGALVSK